MVNSISRSVRFGQTSQTSQVTAQEVNKLLKYTQGNPLKEIPDTFTSTTTSAAKSSVLWEALPFAGLLRNAKKAGQSTEIKNALKGLDKATQSSFKNIFRGKEGSLGQRIGNFFETITNNQETYSAIKSTAKTDAKLAKALKNSAKLNEYLKAHPKNIFAKFLKAINDNKGTKILEKISNETITTKAAAETTGKVAAEAGKTVGRFGKIGKLMKTSGAGFLLAINGVIELGTEIIPTFKELGVKKGLKQTGKSAVKVAANTAGYIAGAKAGTVIGATIGSVIPGAGTAIGGAMGFIGGLAGSFLAGKLATKITGKSEREKAKEQQENTLVNEIKNDYKAVNQLKQLASEKIQQEAASGKLSDDAKTIKTILSKNPAQQHTTTPVANMYKSSLYSNSAIPPASSVFKGKYYV